jgi:phenylpropionate dioxygenase-like ring-hydroxylating dioxygenase large terminal subunit
MPFIQNLWYVAAWANEFGAAPIGQTIIDEPVVLFRMSDGTAVAMENCCPHRHVPLSHGRIEGDSLRCMYHGMRFAADGSCTETPGAAPVNRQRVFMPHDKAPALFRRMIARRLAAETQAPRSIKEITNV